MARETYTVAEVAEMLGISLTVAYEGIRSGEIPSLRVGRRILVPRGALNELLTVYEGRASDPNSQELTLRKKTGCPHFYREGQRLPWASTSGGDSSAK